jgi:hypothetical protein
MYLNKLKIENIGPIASLDLTLPFRDELPQPVVVVGPNGSGKTTLLSFVVNSLVGFKQQAFEDTEVDANRVYRLRSPGYLRGGASWYHARLEFEGGLTSEEWVLDRSRKRFEAEVEPLPTDEGWKQTPHAKNSFIQFRQNNAVFTPEKSPEIRRLFDVNAVLFYPSDRFASLRPHNLRATPGGASSPARCSNRRSNGSRPSSWILD